jgi:hypothetical protein
MRSSILIIALFFASNIASSQKSAAAVGSDSTRLVQLSTLISSYDTTRALPPADLGSFVRLFAAWYSRSPKTDEGPNALSRVCLDMKWNDSVLTHLVWILKETKDDADFSEESSCFVQEALLASPERFMAAYHALPPGQRAEVLGALSWEVCDTYTVACRILERLVLSTSDVGIRTDVLLILEELQRSRQ